MKTLFIKLPLVLLSLVLITGCGKENSSGDSKSSLKNSIGVDGYTNVPQNFQNITEVRKAFQNKSMADGLTEGMDIYHVGTYFGGQSGTGFSGSYEISGCLNLIFWQYGDCDSGGYNYMEQMISEMESIINNGRLLKVRSASANSVSVQRAVGVDSQAEFIYSNETLSKDSGVLSQMVAGDEMFTTVRSARISLSNGQQIEGVAVYNQYGVFVITTNLPLAANPVYVQSGTSRGYLSKVGQNVSITNVSY